MQKSGFKNIGALESDNVAFGYDIEGSVKSAVWDMANPDVAANATIRLYGSAASVAAAHCALSARCDGRDYDYRFWFEVFKLLRSRNYVTI